MTEIIDKDGFRHNVGIIVCNDQGQLLWARRRGNPNAWQFPQGGINQGETPELAMWRELREELGLMPADVELLAQTRDWLTYNLPKRFQRRNQKPLCIGQKQKWFLLRLTAAESKVNLAQCEQPEFDQWGWVEYWYPVDEVIDFKRDVYQQVLKEFSPIFNLQA